ncbi:MAG: MBL fold metallo-hydrolase [Candidatus Coatesbacteria bacterium]|nr:MBL fold metallo-hydrolase [Candidatus Coatesbacteria bacterium]
MKVGNTDGAIKITILYDNYPYQEGLKTGWGFSCLVSGLEKTILFDTGADGEMLLDNMRQLQVDPNSIDIVFLSHIDGDHTDGLGAFLRSNPNVSVFVPASFPERFTANVESMGAEVVSVEGPSEVCHLAYSTGDMGGLRREHALVIKESELTTVITGCAHPGIAEIVSRAGECWPANSMFIVGGFHLFSMSKGSIRGLIEDLKRLGVKWAAPCHCSGDVGRNLFGEAFGDHYLGVGVGREIDLSDLR